MLWSPNTIHSHFALILNPCNIGYLWPLHESRVPLGFHGHGPTALAPCVTWILNL